MSEVINPPDYYFTGINFNPAFYADDSGGGLSESLANTLYLRKTIPDTATAIETFNLGIKAQKVDGLLTSSIMYVGNNITSGSLILGNTPIRTKNQGIFETASIRAPATNGTVAICGDATAGGGVDIGTSVSTTNLNGTTQTNTIQGISTTGDQSFFTTKTANNLNVFASSGSTAVLNVKGSGIKFDTLSTDNPTGAQSLYSNKTGGSLNIGTVQTSGSINIGATGSTTTTTGTSINLNTTVGASTGLFTTGRSYLGGTTSATFAAHNISQVDATYRDCLVMHANVTNGMAFILFRGFGGSVAGGIDNNGLGTGVAYVTSSDRRLKTNIQPMTSMIDNMMKLKPSKYNWISNTNIEDYGFIAQEVFELFPEMRNKRFNANDNLDEPCDENGNPIHYGLDYGKFTPYIVKAIQELKEEYDTKFKIQETKLSTLEARLLALETKPPHVEVIEPHETVIV